jgi:excisionase family DNA binding protein
MVKKDWYTTGEIAALTGFSDRWVRRQIEAGLLPATRFDVGQRATHKIARSDFEAFRARYLVKTQPSAGDD